MHRRQFLMSGIVPLTGLLPFAAPAAGPGCPSCAPADPARFKPSLLLAVKNRSFLTEFADKARAQGQPDAKPLSNPLVADLVVVVEDRDKISRFVTVNEGQRFGLSDKEVMDAAHANLKRRVDKLQIYDFGPVRALAFDENYNASLLLLPNVWSSVPDLPKNLVVAVPARDIVAFGDGSDARIVASLRQIAAMPANGFPVTRHLLQRAKGGWGVLA